MSPRERGRIGVVEDEPIIGGSLVQRHRKLPGLGDAGVQSVPLRRDGVQDLVQLDQ